jgi:hypothetical protein
MGLPFLVRGRRDSEIVGYVELVLRDDVFVDPCELGVDEGRVVGFA